MGLYLRAKATSGVPGKLQLAWEMGVHGGPARRYEGSIGPEGLSIVPLAVTLFVFILVANWFSVLGHRFGRSNGSGHPRATST